ncbi:nitrate- and nitrite sensing domain-containing protein [Spongiactinospora sp. 9N601]|uniref:sensor histidine kinase n=1 Tax=Spongiactinospora sp. 9N601 TaxID=3375149 RepID=UPI0037B5A8F9
MAATTTQGERGGRRGHRAGGEPGGESGRASKGALPSAASHATPGGRWPSVRNWRVRSRLIVLVLIPTMAGVVLGGFRIADSVAEAEEYERARALASFAITLGDLAHELELERDLAARFVAAGRRAEDLESLRVQEQQTVDDLRREVSRGLDAALAGSGSPRVAGEITQIRTRLKQLDGVRASVVQTEVGAEPVLYRYNGIVDDLLAVHDEIGQGLSGGETLANGVTAFQALAEAKEHASSERALLSVAIASGGFSATLVDELAAARAERESALATFKSEATLAQRQFYDDTVTGQKVDRAEYMRLRAVIAATGGPVSRSAERPVPPVPLAAHELDRWFDAASDTIERMRVVERRVGAWIVTTSLELRDRERRGAVSVTVAVALLLLMVLGITAVMARSLAGPLRRLRDAALEVAGRRLPETVNALREGGETAASEALQPIGVTTRDEIGEVARAFDEVHREAVRLAGQEATLRNNVNAMFVNLSRRSQTLVERQLTLIESLEQGEQDEGRLGNLFRLDHLATRMRRNSENLLVLAGQEPARRWSRPVPLIDVARAALSEIENYERVALRIPTGPAVVGSGVNDLVHLIAELVENAISFSPSETAVTVSTNRIDGGGMMIAVSDVGIGMTAAELSQANWRLANPPVVDVSVSRRMGLFVVGRLALRHGIRVQLRQQETGGLTAMVLVPDTLLAESEPWNGVSRAAHERQAALAPGGVFGGPAPAPMFTPQAPAPREDMWSDRPRGGDSGAWDVHVPPEPPVLHDSAAEATGPIDRITGGAQDRALAETVARANGSGIHRDPDDYLPIFAAVESDWFRAASPREESGRPGEDAPPPDPRQWTSPADPGYKAAAQVAGGPALGGITHAGLPKRVPKANLLPGAVAARSQGVPVPAALPAPVPPRPPVSPEAVRDRLAGFQQGVRQARAAARGEPAVEPAGEPAPTDFTWNIEHSKEDS